VALMTGDSGRLRCARPSRGRPGADPPERPHINAMGAGNPILVS